MTESTILEDPDSLSSPEKVALDGYNALMNGDDKVVSGLKNKITVAISNLANDSLVAHRMGEMQKPVNEK